MNLGSSMPSSRSLVFLLAGKCKLFWDYVIFHGLCNIKGLDEHSFEKLFRFRY